MREVRVETCLCGVDFRALFQCGNVAVHYIVEVVQVATGLILHVQLDIAGGRVTRNHRGSKEQYLSFLDDLLCTHKERDVDDVGVLHHGAVFPILQFDNQRTVGRSLTADKAITGDYRTGSHGGFGGYQAVYTVQYFLSTFL